MRHILKAEFEYNKVGFLVSYVIVAVLFTLEALLGDRWDVYDIVDNSAVVYLISLGIIGSHSDKERRDRMHSLLPVSVRQVSIARLLFCLIYQATFFAVWFVVYLVTLADTNPDAIWSLITINGLALTALVLFVIFSDLKHFENLRYRVVFLVTLLAILALFLLTVVHDGLFTHVGFMRYVEFGKSPLGALFFTLLALGLFTASAMAFERRKSYVA